MTAQTLNWRRGFFRLWLIIAALWAILVAALFAGSIFSPYVASLRLGLAYNRDGLLESFASGSREYAILKSAASDGALLEVSFDSLVPGIMFFAPKTLADEESKPITAGDPIVVAAANHTPDKDEVVTYVRHLGESRLASARWAALVPAAEIALLPPLCLLALGAAIGWALAGLFSARPSS